MPCIERGCFRSVENDQGLGASHLPGTMKSPASKGREWRWPGKSEGTFKHQDRWPLSTLRQLLLPFTTEASSINGSESHLITAAWLVRALGAAVPSLRNCRVEEGRGSFGHSATPRLPSPLIKPDVRISRIRLSDRLQGRLTAAARDRMRVSLYTPSSPKMTFMEKPRAPRPSILCRLARKRRMRTQTWRSTAR